MDHLSWIMPPEDTTPIYDTFSDEHLFVIMEAPWYADIVNYLVTNQFPLGIHTLVKGQNQEGGENVCMG